PGVPSGRTRLKVSAIVMLFAYLRFNGGDILVAPARQVHQDDFGRSQLASHALHIRDRVRRLERGQDAFEACERLERRERLVVGHVRVLGATERSEPGMLGADCRVVEPGGNRMRELDVAVLVLEDKRPGALKASGPS